MSLILGADPEITLKSGRTVIYSSDVCPDYLFGSDGGGVVAEIRPEPANDPMEMFANVYAALSHGFRDSVGEYEWYAGTGTRNEPTGGHLHLAVPRSVRYDLLDAFIGTPLVAMEPSAGRWARRESYGRWSDVRRTNYGVEYRTPSSWLVSPAVTKFALTLAWLVVRNVDQLEANIPSWLGELSDDDFAAGRSATILLRQRGKEALEIIRKVCPEAGKYARILAVYDFITEVLGDWGQGRDIREVWGFMQKPAPSVEYDEDEALEKALPIETQSSIRWNSHDAYIRDIAARCGPVRAHGNDSLFVCGARESRNNYVYLSRPLYVNPGIQALMKKLGVECVPWTDVPHWHEKKVLGLPFHMRENQRELASRLVRAVALHAFGRIKGLQKPEVS